MMIKTLIIISITMIFSSQINYSSSNRLFMHEKIKQGKDTIQTNKDFFNLGIKLIANESINDLKLGLTKDEIIKILGKPDFSSDSEYWEADALFHQIFKYTNQGVEIDFSGENDDNKKTTSITIFSPCKFKTCKNIGIGISRKAVIDSYKDYINPEFSDSTTLVAGSIYAGVIFKMENIKVKSIFIGAAAE